MTDREALVQAVADHSHDDTPRLALADWLDEHNEPARAEFVRLSCEAARKRCGTPRRADLLDRCDSLLANHEAEWLGHWKDRLIDWEFRRGFLHRVRLTTKTFLEHGDELFRLEPVRRVELVNDTGEAISGDAVREVVAHPAFAFVRDCDMRWSSPVAPWLAALAANRHVTRLRCFRHVGDFDDRRGLSEATLAAFCQAEHLHTLTHLDLSQNRVAGKERKHVLVERLAESSFAANLRSLRLRECGLNSDAMRHLASGPVFSNLRALDVMENKIEAGAWQTLFHSTTLRSLRSLAIGARQLPRYARSPLARQVRNLAVHCDDDLDRNLAPDRKAWLELIASAPPPRRLTMSCHNPGNKVFAAMRRTNWLRDVRRLSISGDSQYEVYSGRTAGIRSLFGPRSMPKLARLRLHEACDSDVLETLEKWQGIGRLESLELTDDYHGRLRLARFDPKAALGRLHELRGVILITDADVERFLGLPCLERLRRLKLSFVAEYAGPNVYLERVSVAAAERLVRTARFSRLAELELGFHYVPNVHARLAELVPDSSVLPGLRSLKFYGSFGNAPVPVEGLRARFGSRVVAF